MDKSISEQHGLTNPFGIYVHIPFCVHKCSYCDFYSFTKYTQEDFANLTRVMTAEIAAAAKWLENQKGYRAAPVSIFFGGGTPSLLPVPNLVQIFESLNKLFPFTDSCEITTEANPETVNETWLSEIKKYTPINRISLGAQSFDTANLEKLERLCGPEKVVEAAGLLKKFGYYNFNLDLIAAIPGQTEKEVKADLTSVFALQPKHISSYTLSLKPGHALYEKLPHEDLAADLYEATVCMLEENGYLQYEISNYAQEGYQCAHNLLYWTGGDFLGVGPSAASRFFFDGVFCHKKNISDLPLYLSQAEGRVADYEVSTAKQTVLEASFLELRCNAGVDLEKFKTRYGWDFQRSSQFALLREHKLITLEGLQLKLTAKGRLLADTVTSRLVD